jgi:hypothetical protein
MAEDTVNLATEVVPLHTFASTKEADGQINHQLVVSLPGVGSAKEIDVDELADSASLELRVVGKYYLEVSPPTDMMLRSFPLHARMRLKPLLAQ